MDKIPLIMAVWQRIDQLEGTLAALETQSDKSFIFCILNNNIKEKERVEEVLKKREYSYTIKVRHNLKNESCWGRFLYAREILKEKEAKYIAIIDDDILFKDDLVENLKRQAAPNTLKSFWAFRFIYPGISYWGREAVKENGGRVAHYCGAGGCIFDSTILKDDRFFNFIPPDSRDYDDIWFSFFASYYLKWQLKKADLDVSFFEDDKNLMHKIAGGKTVFLRFLKRKYNWPNDYTVSEKFRSLKFWGGVIWRKIAKK